MERRRLIEVFIFLLALLTSCNQQMKFQKEKWNEMNDMFYANREKMIADLMKSHLKKGMKYSEVLCLLGNSENYQNNPPNTLVYEIMVDYGWNIDPKKGKTLYIELTKDSIVKNIKLQEWKH